MKKISNENNILSLEEMLTEAIQQPKLEGSTSLGIATKQPTKPPTAKTLLDSLQHAEHHWLKQPQLTPAEKKIKKKKIKLLCQLVEDFLERDCKIIIKNFGLRSINGEIITSGANDKEGKNTAREVQTFNDLVYSLLGPGETGKPHISKWQDSAFTTYENLETLRKTWNIAKEFIYHHDRYNMEHATLPILLKEGYIHVTITHEYSENEAVRFKTVPNILVHNFIRFLDGLPLKYFALCQYEKCNKCIIATTSRKIFCTHNNCGSLASIDRQRTKNINAFREKDRIRKKEEYAAKKSKKRPPNPKSFP